jgi:hypothetical protein
MVKPAFFFLFYFFIFIQFRTRNLWRLAAFSATHNEILVQLTSKYLPEHTL